MLRAALCHASAPDARQLLISLLAMLLLATAEGVVLSPTHAAGPGGVATIRQGQMRAESAMRRADRQVRRLQRQDARHARKLHQATRRLERSLARRDAARQRADGARKRLATERAVRDRRLRVHPSPTGFHAADRPRLRRRVKDLQARFDRLEARAQRLSRRTASARRLEQARSRHSGRARIEAREGQRESAESRLAGYIGEMLTISKERAADAASRAPRGFRRPTRGHISQRYGCQAGRPSERGQADCRHFHDGVDIATRAGTSVRASADGYVAYVGWNPWDARRRAFVVIIGHARGIETIYGHLKPVRKVRAGQRVRRGQAIGVVGLTGHTTGPHVHWEVSRNFQTMDPLAAAW